MPNCRLQRRGLEYLRDHRCGSVAVTLQTRRLDHRPTQGAGALPAEWVEVKGVGVGAGRLGIRVYGCIVLDLKFMGFVIRGLGLWIEG